MNYQTVRSIRATIGEIMCIVGLHAWHRWFSVTDYPHDVRWCDRCHRVDKRCAASGFRWTTLWRWTPEQAEEKYARRMKKGG